MNIDLLKRLQSIEYNDCHEYCPICESDDTIVNEFKKYECVECGFSLLPCSLCSLEECRDCPF